MTVSSDARTDRTVEPEDARRGHIAPSPADDAEARADREMAEAERAVALGTATEAQRTAVDRIAHARTHEERRAVWLAPDAR